VREAEGVSSFAAGWPKCSRETHGADVQPNLCSYAQTALARQLTDSRSGQKRRQRRRVADYSTSLVQSCVRPRAYVRVAMRV
jgi:hypothetical protein